ncbi:tape measure protein [uncultured Oscillibacter sp.]|uniref:tape measure protein n=1 Tax=uncultured Oscillibacter sp. TaxID=876091 RepID=UPI002664F598|nr:tape measure protein [uncultured Oscillibacter sp.]
MAQTTKTFNKDVDALEEQLHQLSTQKVSLKVDLDKAQKALKDAQKQFAATGDEADGLKMQLQQANYDNIRRNFDLVTRAARDTQRQLDKTGTAGKNAGTAVQSGVSAMVGALATSGIGNMVGQLLEESAGIAATSLLGSGGGTVVSNALSSAASGAAIGTMIAPGVGTAIGALAGGAVGVLTGASQVEENRDESFKSYVQESVEGQLSEMDSIRASGSSTAGQREQDQIAFAQRFGSEEAAQSYLGQVRAMAVNTNYTYDEITGYSKSLLNSYSAEETLGVLQKLSDATAGLNLDSSGVSMFIAGLSRMRTTNKVTQEYLNYFSERGLDVYDALARGTGADKSQIAGMVTDGDIGGTEAAQYILDYIQEEFGGLSEKLASTYDAMVDNLGDAEANLNARMGEGYNEARKSGIQAQMDWLESDQLGEAYEAIGAWKAEMENAKEQYIRDAVNEAMDSEDYQTAQAEGDAAEMGRIIMQAKIQGMNEYNANEGKDEVLAQELALIEGVRSDTSVNDGYWDAGYTLGQEFSKGRLAGMRGNTGAGSGRYDARMDPSSSEYDPAYAFTGYATGLERVPYNNFPALLHEGERVLTAREARNYARGGGSGGIQIIMNGTVIREEADIDRVAQRLLNKILAAKTAGVYGE